MKRYILALCAVMLLAGLCQGCSDKPGVRAGEAEYLALTDKAGEYLKKHVAGKAIKLLKKAERIKPDYAHIYYLLGRAYVYQKKFEKADEEFDVFIEKMQDVPEDDEALVDYYVSALGYIAYLHATMKKYEKAARECKEILKFRPDDERAHYNLAVCYYIHYRNRERAFKELQEIIDNNPNTHLAARARFYIDYLRKNPDPRFIGDFSFIEEKEESLD